MNRNKWARFTIIGILSLFLLLKYQNCAPAMQMETALSDGGVEPVEGLPVSTIDPVRVGDGVAFEKSSVEIPVETSTFTVQGYCEEQQEGATLRWELRDSTSEEVGTGLTDCLQGVFTVELRADEISGLQCGQLYQLSARLGLGHPGEIDVLPSCPGEFAQAN